MSKLDVLLWLTVKWYSEVCRSNHHKKILTNVKNVRKTKVQKRFIYGEKKGKHGT